MSPRNDNHHLVMRMRSASVLSLSSVVTPFFVIFVTFVV